MKKLISLLFIALGSFLMGGTAFILSGDPGAGYITGGLAFAGALTFDPGNVLAMGLISRKNMPISQMNSGMPGAITPQQKIITVNNRAGNSGIAKQQGTTRIIYDTLPVSNGDTVLRFFTGAGNRQFPFTNMDAENGKMGVGEAMVIKYINLFAVQTNEDGDIDGFTQLWNIPQVLAGELEIVQGNQTILKRVALSNMFGSFNKSAEFEEYSVLELETDLVLMPQIEFTVFVRLSAPFDQVPNNFIRCTLEGPASILNLQQNV